MEATPGQEGVGEPLSMGGMFFTVLSLGNSGILGSSPSPWPSLSHIVSASKLLNLDTAVSSHFFQIFFFFLFSTDAK